MTRRNRVLVLGATGLLGSHLGDALADRYDTYAPRPRRATPGQDKSPVRWLAASLDAMDGRTLLPVLDEASPDCVVNCVAITPGSPLAEDPVACIAVNSLFPHQLTALSRTRGFFLLHVSTDGVFSGRKGQYRESDTPDPTDLYGRTKWLGEISGERVLSVRTSFFGLSRRGTGLVNWLLGQEGRVVEGHRGSRFTGLSAPVLARLIADLLARTIPLTGLYHVGGPAVSKHDLLVGLAEAFRLRVTIKPVDAPVLDRTLDSTRFWAEVSSSPPALDAMVAELAAQRVGSRP